MSFPMLADGGVVLDMLSNRGNVTLRCQSPRRDNSQIPRGYKTNQLIIVTLLDNSWEGKSPS